DACILQSRAAAETFFVDLARSAPELPQSLRGDLDRAAADAAHAYADFAGYLTGELRPKARKDDAVGLDYYALASQEFLGTKIDLAETYAWGLAELDRIVAEQQHIVHALHPGWSIEQAREHFS